MAKKPPMNNPALAFLTKPEEKQTQAAATDQRGDAATDPAKEDQPTTTVGEPPKGYKRNPEYVEIKKTRVQLVLQPSVVKRLKKAAGKKKLSMNETANRAIIEYLEREGF